MKNIILLLCYLIISVTSKSSELFVTKYDGLIVQIDDNLNVTKNEMDDVINNLKDLLTAASSALYTATKNRVSLGNVTIIIPQSWTIKNYTSFGSNIVDADVVVSNTGMGGGGPYTIQSGVCGGPGQKLSLPLDYVLNENTQANYGDPGKFLGNELLKLRYGVYDEFGLPSSSENPVSFMDNKRLQVRPTGCTDPDKMRGKWINSNGEACQAAEGNNDCRTKVTSASADYSTMFVTAFDSVQSVCDESNHDFAAPTLHNTICGKSVLSVILDHPDFSGADLSVGADNDIEDPTFNLIQCEYLPTVILVDMNGGNIDEKRSDIKTILTQIKKSIRTVIENNNIPSFGLATFSCTKNKSHTPTFCPAGDVLVPIEDIDIDRLLSCIEESALSNCNTSEVGWALDKVLNKIENVPYVSKVSLLVIQMQRDVGQAPDLSEVEKEYFISGVLYGGVSNNYWLDDLTFENGGNYFPMNVYDGRAAMTSILSIASDVDLITLFQDKIHGNTSYKIDVYIDATIGINTTFQVKMYRSLIRGMVILKPDGTIANDDAASGALEDPSASVDTLNNIQFPHFLKRSHTISDAEEGLWSLIILFEKEDTFYASITSHPREEREQINVDLWTSSQTGHHDLGQSPLSFYVSAKLGPNPIADAEVTLKLLAVTPDGHTGEMYLPLKDNGNKFPDTQKHDGIYSGYLNNVDDFQLDSGTLEINFDIFVQNFDEQKLNYTPVSRPSANEPFLDDNMPVPMRIPLCRQLLSTLSQQLTGARYYDPPPSQILDFSILRFYKRGKKVAVDLQWTSPGADFTEGTVADYDIRYTVGNNSLEDMESWLPINENDVVDVDTLEPQEAGTLQNTTLLFNNVKKQHFIVIRGIDLMGNNGAFSPKQNFVPLLLPDDFVGSAAFVFLILLCIALVGGAIAAFMYLSKDSSAQSPFSGIMSRFRGST